MLCCINYNEVVLYLYNSNYNACIYVVIALHCVYLYCILCHSGKEEWLVPIARVFNTIIIIILAQVTYNQVQPLRINYPTS